MSDREPPEVDWEPLCRLRVNPNTCHHGFHANRGAYLETKVEELTRERDEWETLAEKLADWVAEYQVHDSDCKSQSGRRCTCALVDRIAVLAEYREAKRVGGGE